MDREWGRSEQNKGITGTHTRLLVFNMTQYDKVDSGHGLFFAPSFYSFKRDCLKTPCYSYHNIMDNRINSIISVDIFG